MHCGNSTGLAGADLQHIARCWARPPLTPIPASHAASAGLTPAASFASRAQLAAERSLLAMEGLDVRVLRLPFVHGDGDPHIEEVIPMMRGFPPTQRISIGHHADVAQAVARLLDTPSPAHRIYNLRRLRASG